MIFVARSLQVWPASQLPCLVCLTNCDETHQTFQPGREALAHPGRCPLAAVAVAGCRTLLPSRHAASPGLGCLRPAIAVSSAVAVVAAVRVQLSHRHRLGAALSHHGSVAAMPGVTEPTLALVPRAKYRHASAAPLAGLITFRPLHSISLQFRRSPVRLAPAFPFHSFRRPQTAETVKDSGAPKDSRGRDAPHIGQDRQYGRATSSGQEISNSPRCFARARHRHYGARLRLSPRTRQ